MCVIAGINTVIYVVTQICKQTC